MKTNFNKFLSNNKKLGHYKMKNRNEVLQKSKFPFSFLPV